MKRISILANLFLFFAAINVWAFSIGPITVAGTNSAASTNITVSAPLIDATPGHTNWVSFTITSTNGLSWRSIQGNMVDNSVWINTNWNPYFTGDYIIDVTAYDDLSWPIPATASITVTVTRAASTSGKVNSVKYSSAPYNADGVWSNVDTALNAGIRLSDIGLTLDASGVGFVFCNLMNATNVAIGVSGEDLDIAYNDIVRYKPAGTPFRFDVNLHARPRGFIGMGEIKRWIWAPDNTNVPDGPGVLVVDITSCSPWRSSYSNVFQSHVGFAPLYAAAGSATVPTGMIMCTSAHCLDVGSTNTGTQTEMRCGLRVNGHTGTNSYLKVFLSDTFLQQQYQLTNVYDATNVMAGFVQHFGVSTDSVAQVAASFTRIVGGTGTNLVYDYNFDGVGDSGYEARLTFTFQSAVAAQMGMTVTNSPSVPTNVSASKGTYINNVRITWDSVSNATSYQVWRNTANATNSATKFDTEPTSATFNDTNVPVGIVYYYWVKAKNVVGASDFSSSDSGYAMGVALSADFDGDGLADPAIYNTNGIWKIKLSSGNYTLLPLTGFLGGSGYTALAADFDGDGKADPAIYNAALELWAVKLSSLNYLAPTVLTSFGGSGWQAIAGDFDGDGLADPALYNTNGTWKVKLSTANYTTITSAGLLGRSDWTAIASDFDGDGKVDPAIYNASTGSWIVLLSKANYAVAVLEPGFLGSTGYTGLAADFDGDAYADPAVAQDSTGNWKIKLSSGNYSLLELNGFLGGE